MIKKCLICGQVIKDKPSHLKLRKTCSKKCQRIYFKSKKHSKETKRKIRLAHTGKNNINWKGGKIEKICLICGKKFLVKPYRKLTGKYCSRICQKKAQKGKLAWNKGKRYLQISGKNNPNWKGGITLLARKRLLTFEWNELRKKVYQRDNYTCQECKKTANELRKIRQKLQAHHLIPYRISEDDSLKNLITLCSSCHIKVERRARVEQELKNYCL